MTARARRQPPTIAAVATQSERRDQTRRSVVAAAIKLFDGSGDTSASLEDIAALAGVAKSTVVYHFESRIGLLQVVARRIFAEAQQGRDADESGPGAEPDPVAWIAALLRSQTDARARVLHAIDDELTSARSLGDADPAPWLTAALAGVGLSEPEIATMSLLQVSRRIARGLIDPSEIDDIAKRVAAAFG